MQRRQFLLAGGLVGTFLLGGQMVLAHVIDKSLNLTQLKKSKDEWRKLVSRQAFNILFEDGTEPPGSSPLDNVKQDGTFVCAACYLPLFEATKKYDSGTGWPSFKEPIAGRIDTKLDLKLIWPRTEYHCIRCEGHQGHLFKDGPKPLGLRYCNNGLALRFVPIDQALPTLRG